MKGIIVDQKDVMNIEGCSKATASRRMTIVKDALNIKKVTVYQFCKYYGYTIDEFLTHSKPSSDIPNLVKKISKDSGIP